MMKEAYHLRPRIRVLGWLSDMGADISEDVRDRLAETLAASTFPAILGAVNSACIAVIGYLRLANEWLLWLALLDVCILGLRLTSCRIGFLRPWGADILVLSGLLWAVCLSAATAIIVSGSDLPMSILAVATALGSCAGIMARNYAAIRMALTQIIMIDLSFKLPFMVNYPEFVPLLIIQGVAFPYVTAWMMRQQRNTTVLAISGELESRRQSLTDPLTGLLNRRGFTEQVTLMSDKGEELALFYLDLDGFKQVNDQFGHAAGDDLLREVARRLKACAPNGTVCRPGGDEFLVVMRLDHRLDAKLMTTIITQSICLPYEVGSVTTSVGVSLGVSFFTGEEGSLENALTEADEALYRAKAEGRQPSTGGDAEPRQPAAEHYQAIRQRQKR
ncbi:GGDEF domain-containing protein [Rhizobium oryzicola]|uniref:GGDEF domain-containing protein n=1 Tax=Rhizobium oryzicola TaxID=1232668 RepID=A0ABT8SV28_9HYPH|nr:GGDEF domain-containing protein [Rhizobium oryzicola]MDO1582283.1 GGDEF domain-containing protein [Rhizobium oryzicola]